MDQAAKQQIVERIKQANNILVTVSNNPSVDQLAACIGMTLFLNKLDKHATAVFSGQIPPVVEFLQPEKTIETNTDSLRDFIISLDKSKADKIRYKVEDQFVRIYITPYRTSLSEKDLVFSEGDFNVEVVLALGVKDKAQLDAAITQHGRILHDATVVSVNAGKDKTPSLGQINWQEPAASSLSEMLVSISEAFGTGLIDNQMATAFLTGIVAETERFSNPKTSPKVMTMAAQLMAAGANQQLIVSKLEPPSPPEAAKPVQTKPPSPKAPPSDTLRISHGEEKQVSSEVEVKPGEIHIDEQGNIISSARPKAPVAAAEVQPAPSSATPPSGITTKFNPVPTAPTGEEPPKDHELLDPEDHQPAISPPFTANTQPGGYQVRPDDVMLGRAGSDAPVGLSSETSVYPEPETANTPTLPTPTVDDARSAVNEAVTSPFDPAYTGSAAAEKPAPPPVPPPLPPFAKPSGPAA